MLDRIRAVLSGLCIGSFVAGLVLMIHSSMWNGNEMFRVWVGDMTRFRPLDRIGLSMSAADIHLLGGAMCSVSAGVYAALRLYRATFSPPSLPR